MKKIAYNLAGDRRVDNRAFAWRATALTLASLLLGGLAVANLARQREIDRRAGSSTSMLTGKIDRMRAESGRLRGEIDALKKAWTGELATANRLIERKSFSFVSRLDFLEKAFRPGLRILHVSLVNEASGRIAMTISAQSLRDLFAFYKNLAPYDLAISNEVQAGDEYHANLSFRFDNEKI